MGRRIAIIALALGTVVGYGSGFAHILHAHRAHCSGCHHDQAPPSG
jgi:hypothetical protein